MGDLIQLAAGLPGGVEVAGGERDLHEGRQQPRAPRPADPLVGGRRVRRLQGGVRFALVEAEQGQPGLRRETELVRADEGLLGAGEVADPPTDLTGLVEGPGCGPRVEA